MAKKTKAEKEAEAAAKAAAQSTAAPVATDCSAPPVPTVVPSSAVPPGTPAVPVSVVKDTKNGITRPGTETQTGKVWLIADGITKDSGKPATRKAVVDACVAQGINTSTATTQFGKWAKYNDLIGDKSPGRAEKPAAAPAAPTVAPVAAPPVAEVPAAPNPFDQGYQAYQDALTSGAQFANIYADGTNEAVGFVNGWNQAAADAAAAAAQ